MSIAKAADYKKYARTILKILFTPSELSDSILIANPLYARPGLDGNRMAIWAGMLPIPSNDIMSRTTDIVLTAHHTLADTLHRSNCSSRLSFSFSTICFEILVSFCLSIHQRDAPCFVVLINVLGHIGLALFCLSIHQRDAPCFVVLISVL